jgi:hypothetical protein
MFVFWNKKKYVIKFYKIKEFKDAKTNNQIRLLLTMNVGRIWRNNTSLFASPQKRKLSDFCSVWNKSYGSGKYILISPAPLNVIWSSLYKTNTASISLQCNYKATNWYICQDKHVYMTFDNPWHLVYIINKFNHYILLHMVCWHDLILYITLNIVILSFCIVGRS